MAAAPQLTRERVKYLADDMALQVQKKKIVEGQGQVVIEQSRGIFPKDDDRIFAYHTSTNEKNRSTNLRSFHQRMAHSPKLWNKKFIYVTTAANEDLFKRMLEATKLAYKFINSKYEQYGIDTGYLINSQVLYMDGYPVGIHGIENALERRKANKGGEIPAIDLTNTAAYAATSEANALHFAKIGGIIYWAAKRIQRRFPDLGILFEYEKAQAFNLVHKYDVPVLRITSPEQIRTRGKFAIPGENHRRRKKQRSRTRSAVRRAVRNYEMSAARIRGET